MKLLASYVVSPLACSHGQPQSSDMTFIATPSIQRAFSRHAAYDVVFKQAGLSKVCVVLCPGLFSEMVTQSRRVAVLSCTMHRSPSLTMAALMHIGGNAVTEFENVVARSRNRHMEEGDPWEVSSSSSFPPPARAAAATQPLCYLVRRLSHFDQSSTKFA